ncbi:hypothetical protein JM18_004092 [Phytophthora kernoviae]|uniref:Uncharacterized protein n=1 Tax=Phytophthora kernoviae TaxID=325452 RepID=A0A8T0LVR5_9STRA|nr:hypothetical protein JM16_004566 [Phytophthora kernoviae]KAG2524596.1 hypothetical protein JM18_004092 [Phytophthora kernoviae]
MMTAMSTKSVIVLDDSSDEDEEEMAPTTERRNAPLSVSSSGDESDARPSQAKKPRVASRSPPTFSFAPTARKGLNYSSSSTGDLESTDELEDDSDVQEQPAVAAPPLPTKTMKTKKGSAGPISIEQSDASVDSGDDKLDDATTLRFARHDGRMYSDALSFSELQAQQREFERLQAQAQRKHLVNFPRKTKAVARNTTLSGTKRKASAAVSAGCSTPYSTAKDRVMKKTTSPSPFVFDFPGSSDNSFSSSPNKNRTSTLSGRGKPMSLKDVVAQERKLARQRKTSSEKSSASVNSKKVKQQQKPKSKPLFSFGDQEHENVIDGTEWSVSEPDDEDTEAEEYKPKIINEPVLLSEASSLESDDKSSSDEEYKPSKPKLSGMPLNAPQSASAEKKKKRGTPSKPSQKKSQTQKTSKSGSKARPLLAKSGVHPVPTAQTGTVTDKLAKPRDATNTVMPSTVWRNVCVDVAPPNLLSVDSGVTLPFLSQFDRPLLTYDEDGDLRSKCKLIPHFGKSTQFVSSALVSDEQRVTQEDMDNRVTEIITRELPRIQACHKRKTSAIITEERAKVQAYLVAYDMLQSNKSPTLCCRRLSEVSALDKSLLNQMKQERLTQRLSLGYKNVWGESIAVEERLFPVDVNQLPAIRPLSRSTAFVGLRANVRVEDDPILRYMPYFGDNDDGGDIDVAWYDAIKSEDSNPSSGLDGEVNEHLLRLIIRECGASDLVITALKKVPGFSQAYSDYNDIKKLDESVKLAARRIKEAKDLISKKPVQFPLSKIATLEPLLDDKTDSKKTLAGRLAPPPTYFDSNLARCHANRGYGLGLRPTEDYTELMVTGIIGDNPCLISAMIKATTCKEIGAFLESERQSKPIRTSSMDEAALSPDVRLNLNGRKRGRAHTSRSSNNRILLNRTRNNRMKDKGANHEYEPCNHEGACDTMGCSCMTRDHTCEKACSCSRDCPNRFLGCKCSLGNCRTKACPCFVAARECNPDLCFTCGASEVPALIFDEERRNMSALDLGICCNVNILRGLHKKIGVAYSTTHGWGAFALEPIKRGEFIYEYHGALLSQDEAERRGSIYDKMTISFLFDADDDSVVDAIRKGNKSKFANHSAVGQKCKGKVLTVGGEHHISIWAQQDIEKGEELFFDYGYHGETAPDWSQLRIKGSARQKTEYQAKKEEN